MRGKDVELQANAGEFDAWDDLVPAAGDAVEDAWFQDTSRKQIYEAIYAGQTRGKWRLRGSDGVDTTLHVVGGTPSGG